jgi:hypothetical protein
MSTLNTHADRIRDEVIKVILDSRLNIDWLPDDVERELYVSIYNVLEDVLVELRPKSWIEKVWNYVKESLKAFLGLFR